MIERVSASSLTPSTRVKVEDLTPMEREALTDQGQIGPEGFLDIEKPVAAPLVDLHAEARKLAVTQLKSVTEQGAKKPVEIPAGVEARATQAAEARVAESLKEVTDELAVLQGKLHTRSPCPRCGLGIDESCEIVPSAADTEEFLKCVLSGSQFKKVYKLFGGHLAVTLSTRDGAGDELVRRVVTDALRSKEIISETEVFAMMRQLTAAASLRRYASKDIDLEFADLPVGGPAEFRAAAMDRMAKIPAQIQNALRPVLTDFHALVDVLTARAGDANFWEGTPA